MTRRASREPKSQPAAYDGTPRRNRGLVGHLWIDSLQWFLKRRRRLSFVDKTLTKIECNLMARNRGIVPAVKETLVQKIL